MSRRPNVPVWREYRGPQHAVAVNEPEPIAEPNLYMRSACGLSGYVFTAHVLDGHLEDVDCTECRAKLGLEERVGYLTEAGWAAVSR